MHNSFIFTTFAADSYIDGCIFFERTIMITIQNKETEKNGIFEAWMESPEGISRNPLEEGLSSPLQVGEMTYVRSAPERMIIDHTRVFDGFEGRGIARQMVMAAVDFARANNRQIVPVCSYAQAVLTRTDEYKDILGQ